MVHTQIVSVLTPIDFCHAWAIFGPLVDKNTRKGELVELPSSDTWGLSFIRIRSLPLKSFLDFFIPPAQRSCWGGILVSLRPSVRPSVRLSVRPSRMPCPLCIIYSYGWILFILGTNDHYHERVCRAPWPLTLTYIFKVIWPWLRKSCLLCSVYSSGWILSIFGTNDHYH